MYGSAERAALIVLALENREIPNTELVKDYRVDLRKSGREKLNKDGLIKTRQDKRRMIHKITEDGVAWFERELADVEAPPRSGPLARAVFKVVQLIIRYGDVSLVDVLHSAALESLIRAAYQELKKKPQDWVRLADLRPRLSGADRNDVDRVLLVMTTDGLTLAPDSDRRAVTDADRAAAIRIGSEDKHLVAIEES